MYSEHFLQQLYRHHYSIVMPHTVGHFAMLGLLLQQNRALMTDFYYPPLDEQTLQSLDVVKELIESHRTYFNHSIYTPTTNRLLNKWWGYKEPVVETVQEKRGPGRPKKSDPYLADSSEVTPPVEELELPVFEGLREELVQAFRLLKSARDLKHTDRVDYAKQSVALLEKIVKLDAAVKNVELVGQFQSTVLQILEEVCSQEQRAQFMAKLRIYLDVDDTKVTQAVEDEKIPPTE